MRGGGGGEGTQYMPHSQSFLQAGLTKRPAHSFDRKRQTTGKSVIDVHQIKPMKWHKEFLVVLKRSGDGLLQLLRETGVPFVEQ